MPEIGTQLRNIRRSSGKTQTEVAGRNRRGAEPINVCDLTQIASFFGVSRSLVATRLRNLRYITADQFESLDELDAQGAATAAHDALALTEAQVESEHDAFCSRLVALAVTAMDRGVCNKDEFTEISKLVGLSESQRESLWSPAAVTSKKRKKVGYSPRFIKDLYELYTAKFIS